MLSYGTDDRPLRSLDWRELVVFCGMAVALLATSDDDSTVRLSTTEEGPVVVLNDAEPVASFLVKVTAVGPSPDVHHTVEAGQLMVGVEAEHSPETGSPWVTLSVVSSTADAAAELSEAASFLRDGNQWIPTSFAGRCEPAEITPDIADCSMQIVVRFSRVAAPGVTTTLTWSVAGQSSFGVDDGKATMHEGTLPWDIAITPL